MALRTALLPHIGIDAFTRLVDYYNGENIEIDRCAAALRAIKEREILEQHRQGASNSQLARQYGYTARGLRKLRRRAERRQQHNDTQKDLFEL